MTRRAIYVVALVVAALSVPAALGADALESFEEVQKLSRDAENEGRECRFAAIVIHASQLHPGMYVVANPNRQQEQGVVVFADGSQMFDEGDIVAIEGSVVIHSMHAAVKASKVEVLGRDVLPEARMAKYFNLRMGYYHARRVSIIGKIDSARRGADGVTTFMLSFEQNHARCCVDGYMHNSYIGKNVVVTGCGFNSYNADGTVHLPVIELAGLDDIKIVNPDYTTPALVDEPGATVLPGKLFTDIVKNLPDAAVHIEASEDGAVISCESSSFSIHRRYFFPARSTRRGCRIARAKPFAPLQAFSPQRRSR